jgi:hypothetical protein
LFDEPIPDDPTPPAPPVQAALAFEVPPDPPFDPTDDAARLAPLNQVSPPVFPFVMEVPLTDTDAAPAPTVYEMEAPAVRERFATLFQAPPPPPQAPRYAPALLLIAAAPEPPPPIVSTELFDGFQLFGTVHAVPFVRMTVC